MDLSQKPLSRLILKPFGRSPRGLTLEEDRITTRGAKEISVSFDDLSAPPSIRTGLLSATIALPFDGGNTLTLRGADKGKAATFAVAQRPPGAASISPGSIRRRSGSAGS